MKRKSFNQGLSICALLILVILTSGCVGPTVRTYGGDKLPKSEVAVIKGWYVFFVAGYMTVDIFAVDNYDPLKATKVEVLPGPHTLIVRIHSSAGLNPTEEYFLTVPFNAEAGHEYKIRLRLAGIKKNRLYIKDANTGTIIFSQIIYGR